ncbi:hypothetical protein [Luteococcus peritonei]|uniref:Uncharacterized protein n=1 Tax=Luteococcus peritonei TaxID=88874 RepID=A0ABW4RVJ8_9ACTN
MPISAARLLEGPRGRRLCLEYALRCEAMTAGGVERELPLWKSLFDTAVAQEGQADVVGWGEDYVPVPTGPEEVAALLRRTRLVEPTDEVLLDMLRVTVATARYWQEPDPEDQMTHHWRVASALERFAQALIDSPLADWWGRPMRRKEQSLVRSPQQPRKGKGVKQALEGWREEERRARKDVRRADGDPRERVSGVWWSIPPLVPSTTGGLNGLGPVGRHLVEGFPLWESAEVVQVKVPKKFDVLEISAAADWVELCRRQPFAVTGSRMRDWYRATGHAGDWVIPDWREVAKDYDGIHLSLAAYLELTGRAIDVEEGTASMIAGFSPDETRWFVDLPD